MYRLYHLFDSFHKPFNNENTIIGKPWLNDSFWKHGKISAPPLHIFNKQTWFFSLTQTYPSTVDVGEKKNLKSYNIYRRTFIHLKMIQFILNFTYLLYGFFFFNLQLCPICLINVFPLVLKQNHTAIEVYSVQQDLLYTSHGTSKINDFIWTIDNTKSTSTFGLYLYYCNSVSIIINC